MSPGEDRKQNLAHYLHYLARLDFGAARAMFRKPV